LSGEVIIHLEFALRIRGVELNRQGEAVKERQHQPLFGQLLRGPTDRGSQHEEHIWSRQHQTCIDEQRQT